MRAGWRWDGGNVGRWDRDGSTGKEPEGLSNRIVLSDWTSKSPHGMATVRAWSQADWIIRQFDFDFALLHEFADIFGH